ncbi:integrase [Streptomyces morookaense]|uniref:integrase n=1 Tax=Streptomyces morookaense TaxID=1970 RepID=UPI0033D6FF5D
MASVAQEMTHEELIGLPVAFPLEVANRALGIGRTRGYDMARRGVYPIRLLRHGRQYRATRYDLHRHLGLTAPSNEQAAA